MELDNIRMIDITKLNNEDRAIISNAQASCARFQRSLGEYTFMSCTKLRQRLFLSSKKKIDVTKCLKIFGYLCLLCICIVVLPLNVHWLLNHSIG